MTKAAVLETSLQRTREWLHEVESVAGAVLRVVERRIAPGQIARVRDAMPEKVRQVWREAKEAEGIQ